MPHDKSPEAELVLRLASARQVRLSYADLIRQLAADSDPRRLTWEMARQSMVPLLGTRLMEAAPQEIDPRLAENLHSHTEAAVRRGAAQELAMISLVNALEQGDLPCLPVKGQALSRALYGRPGMRASSDIDLLVFRGDLWRAVRVLEGRGYTQARGHLDRSGMPLLHVGLLPPPGAGLPVVELHWRLHWYEASSAARVLERTEIDGSGIRRARPVDELASLLLVLRARRLRRAPPGRRRRLSARRGQGSGSGRASAAGNDGPPPIDRSAQGRPGGLLAPPRYGLSPIRRHTVGGAT